MPNADAHLHQAQHNHALIQALAPESTVYLDWVVTIAFYVAVHRVEAWFARKGVHLETHTQRDDWLAREKDLRRAVWPNYKELEFQSRRARYQCASFERDWVVRTLLPRLSKLEEELDKLS
jgi:hypothetical protein